MIIARAQIDKVEGWVTLRFPYDLSTIALLKTIPGSKWFPGAKAWQIPLDAYASLFKTNPHVRCEEILSTERRAPIPDVIAKRLRPYQIEGADFLISRGGALCTLEQRCGKTPLSIAAATALLSKGIASRVIVTYPASVGGEWQRQLKEWANVDLFMLEGESDLADQYSPTQLAALRDTPFLFVGCHYEILSARVRDLHDLMGARSRGLHEIVRGHDFIVIGDELHRAKNPRAALVHALHSLRRARGGVAIVKTEGGDIEIPSGNCIAGWGLTGTPMRNWPRDLRMIFEFAVPGSTGSKSKWDTIYCAGHVDERGFWTDKGKSNEDKLSARLAALSFRLTRADVAPWLPKTERIVIEIKLESKDQKKYDRLERAYAPALVAALKGDDPSVEQRSALQDLAKLLASAKIPKAVDRVLEHADRNIKILVFSHFHETLARFDTLFRECANVKSNSIAYYYAPGSMPPPKRAMEIAAWKAAPTPAVLAVNTLASGVGIDLSDAEVALFLEPEWVPADLRQAEDRLQDVHLGKRTSGVVLEFLLAKDTIDGAMISVLLSKILASQQIVGNDVESRALSETLRSSGAADVTRLSIDTTDKASVFAAITSIRDKWLGVDTPTSRETERALIAADFETHWDPEVSSYSTEAP